MQAFRSPHQHFGDELIKAVIDQHVGDFITNFGDGLIPCRQKWDPFAHAHVHIPFPYHANDLEDCVETWCVARDPFDESYTRQM